MKHRLGVQGSYPQQCRISSTFQLSTIAVAAAAAAASATVGYSRCYSLCLLFKGPTQTTSFSLGSLLQPLLPVCP